MKKQFFVFICCWGIMVSCSQQKGLSEKLWYTSPAEEWLEALPIGNGRLGAMVFGNPETEHLQLNEESLWGGSKEEPYPENVKGHYAVFQNLNLEHKYKEAYDYAMEHLAVSPTYFRSYQPLGDLYIRFGQGKAQNYKRALELENGIATVEYEIDGKRYMRESFVSSKYDAIFYHFVSIDGEKTECEISFDRERDITKKIEGNTLFVEGQVVDFDSDDRKAGGSGKSGDHMKFSAQVAVKTNEGAVSGKNGKLIVSGASGFTVVVSAATDYNFDMLDFDRNINAQQTASEILGKTLEIPYKQIKEEHIRDFSAVYDRTSLKIANIENDTVPTNVRVKNMQDGKHDNYLTQLMFQYGRYLLMSSSGFRSVLPANLQGIWNNEIWAPWQCDFHLNINLQMNYWPAEVCNLTETVAPLSNFMVKLAENGETTANKFIGSNGWMAHHTSNCFGRTTPTGSTKPSQITNGYVFPLAGAWMSLTLWRHYQFTGDEEYLKNTAYPVISGAARFILDFLKENEKGELVTVPSVSPENSYYDPISGEEVKNTVASTIDIAIVRDVFNACILSEKILSEKNLTGSLLAALDKLPTLKIGADGTIQEWYEDYKEVEPGHRHMSHLYSLHPSNQISENTPELFEAAEKTIEKRLAERTAQVGWSQTWIINFYSRLFKGNECLKHISAFQKNNITPNLFDLHPPRIFQIDGNLGFTAGVAEMLIQSHLQDDNGNFIVQLLPALPDDWQEGSVKGLCARGGFVFDFDWSNGKIKSVCAYSENGGTCKLRYDNKEVDLVLGKGEREDFKQ